jgi:hypothetical protein
MLAQDQIALFSLLAAISALALVTTRKSPSNSPKKYLDTRESDSKNRANNENKSGQEDVSAVDPIQ